MTPRFVPFELERWQSTWENRVRFNLSESGVHPLTIQELLGLAGASALPLLEVRLGYAQSNGSDLRRCMPARRRIRYWSPRAARKPTS